jgi:hypothetical protein
MRDASKCVPLFLSGHQGKTAKGTSADNGKGTREPNQQTFAVMLTVPFFGRVRAAVARGVVPFTRQSGTAVGESSARIANAKEGAL